MQQPTGHISAPVKVNDSETFEFILDTAASKTVVAPSLAASLSLQPFPGASEPMVGATGSSVADVFALRSLELDGKRQGLVRAVGHDAVPAQGTARGILGADILANYVVELDLKSGEVRLHDSDKVFAVDGWQVEPLTFNRRAFPLLRGTLDGVPITIVLDTGSPLTLINGAAARAVGPSDGRADPPQRNHQGQGLHIQGATGHAMSIQFRDFKSLSGANTKFEAKRIAVADLPVFSNLGLNDTPAMILGIDKLRGSHLVLDYPRSRLLIRPAAPIGTANSR